MKEVFRSSEDYIQRQLALADTHPTTTRLVLDIADLLTGPTSGGNARYLAECMCKSPREVAERMKEAAERYLSTAPIEEDKGEAEVNVCAKGSG